MQIPIQNIYYLLCYAWNKLEEKDRVQITIDEQTALLDLFAKILINGTKVLLKRGIDKNYVSHTDEVAGVKGKLELNRTLKSNTLLRQKTLCTYDDFSSDILPNRILAATIQHLVKTNGLDMALKAELNALRRMLTSIEPIELKSSLFGQLRFNRNNRFYAFLMHVCQLIHESLLPSEADGHYHFADFTRDDRKMNQLFEGFIRNFYQIEQKKYKVIREVLKWQFSSDDFSHAQFLPQMQTDITLENETEKIIIDAKFYRETMVVNYGKEKIKSENLYQLFSYLLNQHSKNPVTLNAKGILVYPTIDKEYNLNFRYKNHDILIRTVNLNAHWEHIAARLKDILVLTPPPHTPSSFSSTY